MTPTPTAMHRLGNFCFWLAVCMAVGGVLAFTSAYPALACLLGFAALAAAGCGVCAGIAEWAASQRDI